MFVIGLVQTLRGGPLHPTDDVLVNGLYLAGVLVLVLFIVCSGSTTCGTCWHPDRHDPSRWTCAGHDVIPCMRLYFAPKHR